MSENERQNIKKEEDELQEIMDKASKDIRYLLDRGYRRDSAIRFAADHYRLGKKERYILARTVFSTNTATERKKKKLPCGDLKGKKLLIDGYNVIITLESILRGERILKGDDSFLRDIRGVFRNHSNDRFTTEAVEKMLDFLSQTQIMQAYVLLDTQMKNSGQLAAIVRNRMKELSIPGDAGTSKHVDFDLKSCKPSYVVATADGIIIDTANSVIDLPGCIYHYNDS
ncbi:MAG: DUF434 domain-containing protein [Methanolobus sp.]|nr:DUF434 domain-containing protein [Methanolobus sp.]